MNANINLRRIYYAHSKRIYGTPNETEELKYIKEKFPNANVICPHNSIGELSDFEDYLHVVDCCSKVVVSEIDEYVSKGVFSEIARGFSNNTPVFVLRMIDGILTLFDVVGIEIINQNDWKNKYGKIIIKK